jgi:hypothetical protein
MLRTSFPSLKILELHDEARRSFGIDFSLATPWLEHLNVEGTGVVNLPSSLRTLSGCFDFGIHSPSHHSLEKLRLPWLMNIADDLPAFGIQFPALRLLEITPKGPGSRYAAELVRTFFSYHLNITLSISIAYDL